MDREEQRLSHQVKQGWLQKGEASPAFFRALARRDRQSISKMKLANGSVLYSPKEVHDGAISFFQSFLEASDRRALPSMEYLVQQVILQEENERLCSVPNSKEVFDALFSIPIDNSPGPDGFGLGFYRACWHIVGADVVWNSLDVWNFCSFIRSLFFLLILKVANSTSFDKFKPISLCSGFYKVCSKILVNRLSSVLARIISPEQGAFIPGRSIF